MKKYRRENLNRIQKIFQEKTGTSLPQNGFQTTFIYKRGLMAAAIMLCFLGLSAFAYSRFSSLDEGGLAFYSIYKGDGVFEIVVTNPSDKELKLQDTVKLMQWSTAQEVAGDSKKIKLENGVIPPRSEETVRIDVSEGYDIERLEKALPQGDWYYLVLTNNDFAFGQDWMCDISFDENKPSEKVVYGNSYEEYKPDYPTSDELAFADWVWPTVSHAVSNPYGKEHNGIISDHINIAGSKGDEIYAVADGKISETGYTGAYGNYIILDLGNEIRVKYGHLEECKVNTGDEVERGQVIATLGQTGMATGPNLAFTAWVKGEAVNPLADGEQTK
ncbi:MAG: M23 family metallopeptidase [Lachnoclostridium sp.]|nr:M23 family metallopeptidase [Lachnospira sp.]MCM1249497.1 M23 family metallopeptidase [Lachnoclostridium sp.]MCM1536560.1 M23 family metallopeptidase [Clostridium sp.]